MSENEVNTLMKSIENLAIGHIKFVDLSDGSKIAIKKIA
jgi:hypothetical protein